MGARQLQLGGFLGGEVAVVRVGAPGGGGGACGKAARPQEAVGTGQHDGAVEHGVLPGGRQASKGGAGQTVCKLEANGSRRGGLGSGAGAGEVAMAGHMQHTGGLGGGEFAGGGLRLLVVGAVEQIPDPTPFLFGRRQWPPGRCVRGCGAVVGIGEHQGPAGGRAGGRGGWWHQGAAAGDQAQGDGIGEQAFGVLGGGQGGVGDAAEFAIGRHDPLVAASEQLEQSRRKDLGAHLLPERHGIGALFTLLFLLLGGSQRLGDAGVDGGGRAEVHRPCVALPGEHERQVAMWAPALPGLLAAIKGLVALKLQQGRPHWQGLGQLVGLHDLGFQGRELAVELLLQAIPPGGQGLALGKGEPHIGQLAGEGSDLLRQLAGGAGGTAEQGLALLDVQQQAIVVEAGEEG